ncbi:MAG TPA: SDR family NAD(P)-dependent oxidoreductase, partial [Polyangiales bacterium]
GGNGIGAALCKRFAAEGARVVVCDLDATRGQQIADECGGFAIAADVAREADVVALVAAATQQLGSVDLFCSNAGVLLGRGFGREGGPFAADADWQRSWEVNVMAQVYASRAVLPQMLERGSGYLVNVVSAAGLLSEMGSQVYSTTKHAALGFSEWLAISYAQRGIDISCVCPQGVNTRMVWEQPGGTEHLETRLIEPDAVAEAVVAGVRERRFLILPHPEVAEYFRRKASDYDRWLAGMRRYRQKLYGENP